MEPSFLTYIIPRPRYTSLPQKEHFLGVYNSSYHHRPTDEQDVPVAVSI